MEQKITSNLSLEAISLLLLGFIYVVLRWGILRRPISQSEYENWFFVFVAVAVLCMTILWS